MIIRGRWNDMKWKHGWGKVKRWRWNIMEGKGEMIWREKHGRAQLKLCHHFDILFFTLGRCWILMSNSTSKLHDVKIAHWETYMMWKGNMEGEGGMIWRGNKEGETQQAQLKFCCQFDVNISFLTVFFLLGLKNIEISSRNILEFFNTLLVLNFDVKFWRQIWHQNCLLGSLIKLYEWGNKEGETHSGHSWNFAVDLTSIFCFWCFFDSE